MDKTWLLVKSTFWLIVIFIFLRLVIIFAFLYTFLTHFILWIKLRLLSFQNQHGQPTIPLLNLTKSFFIEFFCILASCFLAPFQSWPTKPQTSSTEVAATPILLVHGYLHHQKAWIWFISQLRKKNGIGSIYSINLSPPFASISKLAEQVKNKVNSIQAETSAKQVILIGHSMGGLVNSYFCEYLAEPYQVAKVITLGTPFQGTLTAALTYGQNGQEMSPESSFVTELLEKIQLSTVPYFSIASKLDNMVIPWQSAIADSDKPSNQTVVLEDFGHLRLLISPFVTEQISRWIRQAKPS